MARTGGKPKRAISSAVVLDNVVGTITLAEWRRVRSKPPVHVVQHERSDGGGDAA